MVIAMSLFDVLRQEYITGKVVDKYRLENGNVGLIIARDGTHSRYHIRFYDDYKGHCLENLFGLLKDPFSGRTEYIDKLVNPGDQVELTTSYSKSPFREAYRIHSVRPAAKKYLPGRNRKPVVLPLYGAAGNYPERQRY
jgi:hypothetical protein